MIDCASDGSRLKQSAVHVAVVVRQACRRAYTYDTCGSPSHCNSMLLPLPCRPRCTLCVDIAQLTPAGIRKLPLAFSSTLLDETTADGCKFADWFDRVIFDVNDPHVSQGGVCDA